MASPRLMPPWWRDYQKATLPGSRSGHHVSPKEVELYIAPHAEQLGTDETYRARVAALLDAKTDQPRATKRAMVPLRRLLDATRPNQHPDTVTFLGGAQMTLSWPAKEATLESQRGKIRMPTARETRALRVREEAGPGDLGREHSASVHGRKLHIATSMHTESGGRPTLWFLDEEAKKAYGLDSDLVLQAVVDFGNRRRT